MSVTLRKKDGDLYVDPETGRGELIEGPTKVSQELFSLYSTTYDVDRDWGSNLDISSFSNSTNLSQLKTQVYIRVVEANERILNKQERDPQLDLEKEQITSFSNITVTIDTETQGIIFKVIANVGNPNTEVGKTLYLAYKPLSIKHVPPIPDRIRRGI